MNILLKIMFVLTVFVWYSSSQASGWVYNQEIQYLYAGQSGGRYSIKVKGNQPNPDSCGASFDLVIANNEKFKEMWSLLLTAYTTNKPVGIYLNGCSGAPYNIPVITDVLLGSVE